MEVCSRCGQKTGKQTIGRRSYWFCNACWEDWLRFEEAEWRRWAGWNAPAQGEVELPVSNETEK